MRIWIIDWVVKGEHSTETGKAVVLADTMALAIQKLDISGQAHDLRIDNIIHAHEIVDNVTIVKQASDIPF